jgi:hypothetical protein
MNWIRLTAYPLVITASLFLLMSCERDAEQKKTTDYQRKDLPLTGAQETPATPVSGLGKMDVFYSKETRVLTYTVNWSGLTGAVSAMHIHGLAPVGYAAGVVQNIITSSNGLDRPDPVKYGATGSFSGSMFVDGVAIREEDLINGMYYLNIHTAAYPGGEIRGQIVFQ